MERFDFNLHYDRIRQATTPEEIADIRREYDEHYAGLSEPERRIFSLRLREHARVENIRARAVLDFVNEIMGLTPQTAEPTSVHNIG